MKKGHNFIFAVYLVLALYFVNLSLGFIPIPEVVSNLDKWIILVGGVLLFFGGISFYKSKRHNF